MGASDSVRSVDRLAWQVHERIVEAHLQALSFRAPDARSAAEEARAIYLAKQEAFKQARAARVLAATRARRLIEETSHSLFRQHRRWRCRTCLQTASPLRLSSWLEAGPCPGLQVS